MKHSVVIAATLLLVAIFVGDVAHAQDEFYDAKIESEYTDVSLYCSNTTYLPVNDSNPVSWMLPDLTVIYHSTGRFNITNDNWTLTIRSATKDDLGQYHCLLPVAGGSDFYLVRLGLNAEGPYFQDLWEKYMWNTIIALSASGGFALLSLCLYLIDRFRYREPKRDEDRKEVSVVHSDVVDVRSALDEKENGIKKPDPNFYSNQSYDQSFDEDGETCHF